MSAQRLLHRRGRPALPAFAPAAFVLAAAVCLHATRLNPETTAAFDGYVALTEQRIDAEMARGQAFLWIDTLSQAGREEMQRGLHSGGIVIERLETLDGSKSIDAPDALIHHWVGLVFVPGVRVDSAVALMEDYDRHWQVFAPGIVRSKTLERTADHFRVALRFHFKKIIGVTMDTENEADFFRPASDRAYSRIRSTRIVEIADAGTPREQPKREGEENGFMWRLNTYWRFLERDGGTYIQCESLTLSREVPFVFRWLIKPFVTEVPKESLTFMLERAKAELLKDPVR
ncbi:MAG TPA: hypothetical protein VGZ27_13700 [Vicinamibacterales bacterium]|nr:hypothetical protein [Vicinamibacterales bacterium]